MCSTSLFIWPLIFFNVAITPGLMYCRFFLRQVFATFSVLLCKAQNKTKLKYSSTFQNVSNFLLASELFRVTSQERTDVGKAGELIGLSAVLSIHGKASVYPERCQEITKGFHWHANQVFASFFRILFFNPTFISWVCILYP